MRSVILIAAAGLDNELGKEGDLPWHLPDDFKRFKALTTGYPMIMGRKTFETFPRPLPNRQHIIITRSRDYRVDHPACEVVHSLEEALNAAANTEKIFIIGGGEIYRQAVPFATGIELTRVQGRFDADTYFPEIEEADWELTASETHGRDERHDYPFTYLSYRRKP